jgi:hypothetical protein
VRAPRPHDLLQVDGLDLHLRGDPPEWVRNALHGTGWVVTLPDAMTNGYAVGVRGRCKSQRYTTISPEDIAGVRAWPTRGTPALQALREVRAPLNTSGSPGGRSAASDMNSSLASPL